MAGDFELKGNLRNGAKSLRPGPSAASRKRANDWLAWWVRKLETHCVAMRKPALEGRIPPLKLATLSSLPCWALSDISHWKPSIRRPLKVDVVLGGIFGVSFLGRASRTALVTNHQICPPKIRVERLVQLSGLTPRRPDPKEA